MLTRTQVLSKWLGHWRSLKAWKKPLNHVDVEFSNKYSKRYLGVCYPYQAKVIVYKADINTTDRWFDAPLELYTLVHELAHAVEMDDAHGRAWQDTHSKAIHEVTGIMIPKTAPNYEDLCLMGADAVKTWWHQSGNAFLLKLANG